jgi:hypothetical protein
MTTQVSFSKYEQELRSEYRRIMNSAESDEDVKKFFGRVALDLFERVLGGKIHLNEEDVRLDLKKKDGFVISKRLQGIPDFVSAWKGSDLPHIVGRMAQFAGRRQKHFEKHRDKTEAKMYPTPD